MKNWYYCSRCGTEFRTNRTLRYPIRCYECEMAERIPGLELAMTIIGGALILGGMAALYFLFGGQ